MNMTPLMQCRQDSGDMGCASGRVGIENSMEENLLEEHLGKLVIVISNEIENPMVGYGKEIIYITRAKRPMLVVHDLISEIDKVPFGVIFSYTAQKFDALNKMDANGRIAILFNRLDEYEVDKRPTQKKHLFTADEWQEKVKNAIMLWEDNKSHDGVAHQSKSKVSSRL